MAVTGFAVSATRPSNFPRFASSIFVSVTARVISSVALVFRPKVPSVSFARVASTLAVIFPVEVRPLSALSCLRSASSAAVPRNLSSISIAITSLVATPSRVVVVTSDFVPLTDAVTTPFVLATSAFRSATSAVVVSS